MGEVCTDVLPASLGQLDAIAVDRIHGADVNPIGTDHLGMLFDLAEIGHWLPLSLRLVDVKRTISDMDPGRRKE